MVATTKSFCSWIDGRNRSSDRTFPVVNPASAQQIGEIQSAGSADVDAAIEAARHAFEQHYRTAPRLRADWCYSASLQVLAHEEQLATALSEEHGKPLSDALAEVRSAASGFRVAAETLMGDPGETPRLGDPNKRIIVTREPIGVWAVITPWNFPLNIPVEYLGPALSTGNAVVWKPAPTSARVAALFHEVLRGSDIPEQLLQLVLTDELAVAQHLTTHPGIDAVGFTGGSKAGRAIEKACWNKHLVLELGGNTSVLVFDDADLEKAAEAISNASFWNGGQVCSAAGRVLAADSIADQLAALIAQHANAMVIGDPADSDSNFGPLHLQDGLSRVQGLVDEAIAQGAQRVTGGSIVERAGNFYMPTVLANVQSGARIYSEETFGPVVSITRCTGDDELIAAAKEGEYGLVAAIFTRNLSRAYQVAEQLPAGLVVVNDSSNYWELNIAFGGAPGRRSGRGRLGGRFALHEFTIAKSVVLDIS